MPDRLHVVEQAGSPPLVVGVHGAMDRARSFSPIARALAGHAFLSYDRRGYGRSRGLDPPLPSGPAAGVADLLSVSGDRPFLALGHSYGAVLSLIAAASREPRVLGVVAYEPPAAWMPWWRQGATAGRFASEAATPEDAAERFVRRMIGDARWEALGEHTRRDRRAEGPALLADIARREDPTDEPPFDPGAIDVPVTVLCGSESPERHLRATRELAAAIPGAEHVIVPGADHGGHRTHPDAIAEQVRRLLRIVGGGA